jgi:hypothetical protein
MTRNAKHIAIVGILILGFVTVGPAVAGNRFSARVDEPFELNGKLYPAGTIVVDPLRDYTPTSALAEVWIGADFVGLLRADRVPSSPARDRASLTFERDLEGTLVLVGYASSAHGVHGEFRFQEKVAAEPGPVVASR